MVKFNTQKYIRNLSILKSQNIRNLFSVSNLSFFFIHFTYKMNKLDYRKKILTVDFLLYY